MKPISTAQLPTVPISPESTKSAAECHRAATPGNRFLRDPNLPDANRTIYDQLVFPPDYHPNAYGVFLSHIHSPSRRSSVDQYQSAKRSSSSDRQMSAGFGSQHQLFSPYAQAAYLSSSFSPSADPFRPQKLKRSRQRVDAGEPRNTYSSIPNYTSGRVSMTEPVNQPDRSPSECSGKSGRPAKAASASPPAPHLSASLQQLYAEAAERAGLLPGLQRLGPQPTFFGISDILNTSNGATETEKLSPRLKVEPRGEGESPDSTGGRKRKQSQPERLPVANGQTDDAAVDDCQSAPPSPLNASQIPEDSSVGGGSVADRMQSEMFGLQQQYVQLLARRQQDLKANWQPDAKELSDFAQRIKAELAVAVDRVCADYRKRLECRLESVRLPPPPANGTNRPFWGSFGPTGPFPHPFVFGPQANHPAATIFPAFGPFGHLQPQSHFNPQSRATDEAVSLVLPKKKRSKVTDTRVQRINNAKPDDSGSEASPNAYAPPTMVPPANNSSFLAEDRDDRDSLSGADSDGNQSEFGTFDSTQSATLTPMHLRKAKLMFFYTRYPSSALLKAFFPDIRFNKNNTAQLVKWFSNFREFYYIQMEKYARTNLAEGTRNADEICVSVDSEIYRVLNMHYNRNNHIQVPVNFRAVIEATLREFFRAIQLGRDAEPSWKKQIYKVIARLDDPIPEYFKSSNFLEQLE